MIILLEVTETLQIHHIFKSLLRQQPLKALIETESQYLWLLAWD